MHTGKFVLMGWPMATWLAVTLFLFAKPLPASEKTNHKPENEQSQPGKADSEKAESPQPEKNPAVEHSAASEETDAQGADTAPAADNSSDDEEIEEISITGTRIGRSNLEDFAHITVVSAQEIGMSGVTTVDELLVKMPSVTLQGQSRQRNNDGWGLAFIDLRNLGTERTLVLVNGKRFPKSGGVGEVNFTGVDMNNIPTQLIDRVEVLLDGASAVYGSDAVGGVVNVILKEDFEGVQFELSGGTSTHGDGEEIAASATMGTNFDKGNVVVNLNYMHRGDVAQKDRDWAKDPIAYEEFNDDGSVFQLMGSSTSTATHVNATGINGESLDMVFLPSGGNSYQDWDNSEHRYNFGMEQLLMGKMERYSVTVLGNYELSETTKLYLEGTYTNIWSYTQLAPAPLGFGTAVYPNNAVPLTNPYIPADFRAIVDPDSEFIYIRRRMKQVGNRRWVSDANTFRVVMGAKGEITQDIKWDMFANYGQNQILTTLHNSVNVARMWDTLDPAVCAQVADRGCVVGNYFGEDTLSDEVLDYIRYKEQASSMWDMVVVGGSLYGDLAELPGGPLGVAFGAETRKETGYSRPDVTAASGEAAGNLRDPTEGSYDAQEVFAELSVPLLSKMPGAHALTVDLAARYSRYNTFGNDLTYRAGLSWSPVTGLRLRGIYSTAFRAPSIINLYSGATDIYLEGNDPCNNWGQSTNATIRENCQSQGVPEDYNQNQFGSAQFRTNVGGNPDLEAETAKVFNAGLVFIPEFLPNFSLTFDFYSVIVDNAINSLEPQYIVDSCYQSQGLSHANCTYILPRNANSVIPGLEAELINVNEIKTSGIDFTVNYSIPLNEIGLPEDLKFDISLHGNYLLEYQRTIDQPGGPEPANFEGTIGSGSYVGSYAHLRAMLQLGVSGENWSFRNRLRYISGADVFGADPEVDPTSSVPALIYWGAVASYRMDDLNFILGVNNILDRDPPFLPEGGQNANIQTYDFLGRVVYVKISYHFQLE